MRSRNGKRGSHYQRLRRCGILFGDCAPGQNGVITREDGRADLAAFDQWTTRLTRRIEIRPRDIAVAQEYLRRLDLPLVTPDALHIAIAERVGAVLVTFDRQMAASARALGVSVMDA